MRSLSRLRCHYGASHSDHASVKPPVLYPNFVRYRGCDGAKRVVCRIFRMKRGDKTAGGGHPSDRHRKNGEERIVVLSSKNGQVERYS